MKTSREERKAAVIKALNQARSMELYAISQYMSQHYALDNMDYGELAKNMKLIAIDEMRHAEMFAERVKELDGEPVTERYGNIHKDHHVEKIYPFDANVEDETIDTYNQLLNICRENGDNVSVKLFEQVIEEEQGHYNYFDNIDKHIKTLGASYLSKIAGTPSDTGPASKGFSLAGAADTGN